MQRPHHIACMHLAISHVSWCTSMKVWVNFIPNEYRKAVCSYRLLEVRLLLIPIGFKVNSWRIVLCGALRENDFDCSLCNIRGAVKRIEQQQQYKQATQFSLNMASYCNGILGKIYTRRIHYTTRDDIPRMNRGIVSHTKRVYSLLTKILFTQHFACLQVSRE